jgi:hypothetical protein
LECEKSQGQIWKPFGLKACDPGLRISKGDFRTDKAIEKLPEDLKMRAAGRSRKSLSGFKRSTSFTIDGHRRIVETMRLAIAPVARMEDGRAGEKPTGFFCFQRHFSDNYPNTKPKTGK